MKYIYQKCYRPSYHKASEHSLNYFNSWLAKLEIDEATYEEITKKLQLFVD